MRSAGFIRRVLVWALLALTISLAPAAVYAQSAQVMGELWDSLALGRNPTPAELDRWWESFRDPVLDGLIAEALARNTDVVAAAGSPEARAALLNSLFLASVTAMGTTCLAVPLAYAALRARRWMGRLLLGIILMFCFADPGIRILGWMQAFKDLTASGALPPQPRTLSASTSMVFCRTRNSSPSSPTWI